MINDPNSAAHILFSKPSSSISASCIVSFFFTLTTIAPVFVVFKSPPGQRLEPLLLMEKRNGKDRFVQDQSG